MKHHDMTSNLIVGQLPDGSCPISTLWVNDAIREAYAFMMQHTDNSVITIIRVERRIADDRTETVETPIIELRLPQGSQVKRVVFKHPHDS